jgi:GNAT superfamily N-acetyltransferase
MTPGGLTAPARLTTAHDISLVDCGTTSLNDWLTRRARQNEASGASRTYVVCVDNQVVGYYCLATGAIVRSEAPKSLQRNMPDPIPIIVLGGLAVDQRYQGHGFGKALLRDAILRVIQAADIVGIKAILAHAVSEEARRFYIAHGFLESPLDPMTLCLPVRTAREVLSALSG